MSSSYADYIRNDTEYQMDVTKNLATARTSLKAAINCIEGLAIEEDQTDNAAETGSLAGQLSIALMILDMSLPESPPTGSHCPVMERRDI